MPTASARQARSPAVFNVPTEREITMTLFIDVDQAAALYKRLGVARAIREMAGYIPVSYTHLTLPTKA